MVPVRLIAPFILLSLIGGELQSASPAHGRAGRQAYAGTVTECCFFGTPAMPVDSNFGVPLLWASPLVFDQHDHYFPELAAVVPTVANGGIRVVAGNEVVTARLKSGLRWSDGSPITSADYIGAVLVDKALGVPLEDGAAGECLGPRASVTATSTTLTVTFRGVYAPALHGCLPAPMPVEYWQRKYHVAIPAALLSGYDANRATALLASPSYQGSPLQKLVAGWQGDSYTLPIDVFSGPYKLKTWAPPQVVLTFNPYYAALPPDPHHPRPATFVVDALNAAPPIQQVLATPSVLSRIDFLYGFTYADVPALRHIGLRLVPLPSYNLEHLELNLANPALRDQRVRQALFAGIDRSAYIRAVLPMLNGSERNALLQTSFLPSASPWSDNRSLPQNPYNPAKARALLAAAGFANSAGRPGRHLRLDFWTTGIGWRQRSARALQQQWARLGIILALHYAPQRGRGGLLESYGNGGIMERRSFDIAEFSYATTVDPDPLAFNLDPSQVPDRNHPDGANYTGVRDVTLFGLFLQARGTVDDAVRRRLYNQVQRIMVEQAYYIPLFTPPAPLAVRPTLGNFRPEAYANWDWNVFEWYQGATH